MVIKQALIGKTLQELQEIARALDMPKFTGRQIAEWIYQKRVKSIAEMTNLSLLNRKKLAERYEVGVSEPIEIKRSQDGTVKYLFPTADGKFVETVYIPDGERATLCVSCQVGCKMNCLFCQTGKQGWQGNLTAADILNQIFSIEGPETLTNIVYMGQGEPLDNYDAVMRSLEILTASYGWAWSPRRITVSTCGLRKNLKRFLDESDCHLAVSLHTPLHEQRLRLMPAEKQYPIADIVELLKDYDWSHQRRLTFEYTLLRGNDTPMHAKELCKLLAELDCRVNLIRWHKIPDVDLQPASEESIIAFETYLNRHGIPTTLRASRGQDIEAACGLLSTKLINK